MDSMGGEQDFEPRCQMTFSRNLQCPICSSPAMSAEIDVCPLCGGPGIKPELDEIARQWFEEYRDREMDEEAFGTPRPKVTIQ